MKPREGGEEVTGKIEELLSMDPTNEKLGKRGEDRMRAREYHGRQTESGETLKRRARPN